MDPWHLPETHDLVRKRFDRKQELLVRECTRSIVDRQNFARFHYDEVRCLTKSFERKHLSEKASRELHASDNDRETFERFIIKVGAHATACAQSVHAIPDILAHCLYYACGLNLEVAIPAHKVSVSRVAEALKRHSSLHALAHILSKTLEGQAWDHLAAISNMSKHRSVIRLSLNEDWTGKRKNLREIQFAIFERGGKQYWSKSLEEAIGPEYDRLSKVVIESGYELNGWLRQATA